tara:strand:+ start:292 stop:546 length:255 start_codon:yes stop_codon:yes gene_type:complete
LQDKLREYLNYILLRRSTIDRNDTTHNINTLSLVEIIDSSDPILINLRPDHYEMLTGKYLSMNIEKLKVYLDYLKDFQNLRMPL